MKKHSLLPPFTAALASVIGKSRSDFDTPGHHSGEFFSLTEEGRAFVDAFGASLFEADISDSSSLIGDPSSHEGVSGDAEARAARAWGSDRCFFVLGGTSASNRIAVSALLAEGDLVLFDRNNHKSTYQGALMAAGARPVYLESERNSQGIIGGLTRRALDAASLRKAAAKISPAAAKKARPFRLACLQLATYDGLFLNAKEILKCVGPLCDYILFDGAWAGYENFLPLLKDAAILTMDLSKEAPGILLTQSVHKQLAGFSMTSQLHKKDSHIRNQDRYVPDDLLQSTYLMHISTSPYYPLLAGLEMNALLHETHGPALWEKAARASITLKKEILSRCRLFRPFLSPTVRGRPWESYDTDTILKDAAFWDLESATWNGFAHMPQGLYLADPCKVLLTTRGIDEASPSLPAPFVSAYLEAHGVTAEKSDFYTLLFLSEPGDSEEKGTRLVDLLSALEKAYFENRPLRDLLPGASSEGLADFSARYAHFLAEHHAHELQQALFSQDHFPPSPMTAKEAWQHFIKGNRKCIPLSEAEGEIALELVLPYPPGIAVLVPGEVWTKEILSYFLFLSDYGKTFPDYKPEILGVHEKDGAPWVWVTKQG